MPSRVLVLSAGGSAGQGLEQAFTASGLIVSVVHDIGSAMQRLGQHQLIILDAPDSASLALLCRRINDEAGSNHPPILAIAHSSDVEARVQLLEAGADDVLAMPIDQRELAALAEALLLRSPAARRSSTEQPVAAPRPPESPGRVIAFAAAKGGSGTTALAVNTALILAEMAPGSVALADLDMNHGQVATHLDIYARTSTAALAREDPAVLTPEMINDAGRMHSSGLMVFGGPYRADDGAAISGDELSGLISVLRGLYGTIIVDAGSTLDEVAMAVLNSADRVVMVITPDIPALRLLHASLQVMSEVGTAAERAVFVVNEIHARASIGSEQIEEHLGIKVGLAIPYDGENFLKSVNEGQPLVALARRSAPALAIRRLAETVADVAAPQPEEQGQRRGRLRGFLGRN